MIGTATYNFLNWDNHTHYDWLIGVNHVSDPFSHSVIAGKQQCQSHTYSIKYVNIVSGIVLYMYMYIHYIFHTTLFLKKDNLFKNVLIC